MEDIPGIYRDTFNLYKEHSDKTDWPKFSDEIQKLIEKHKGSIFCAEVLVALGRHLERKENESKENRK